MTITIDDKSGFCFGVSYAIRCVEDELSKSGKLYCLGNIVHNQAEVKRLQQLGMIVINHEQFKKLHNTTVLIRAHGEPPETYQIAAQNNIRLIDATCKVVLKIQQRIYQTALKNENTQIIIYGKANHPEVVGFQGQVNGKAIVVEHEEDLNNIDFFKPIHLFSQTTMPLDGFRKISELIQSRMRKVFHKEEIPLYIHDTVCRQVANRMEHLKKFASENDIIIFASSKDSSNGKLLFEKIKQVNSNTYFISSLEELNKDWFVGKDKIGICGATSTPQWFMQQIKEKILNYL